MKNILDLKIEKLNNWTVVNDGSGNEFSSPILSNNNEGVNDIYRTCNFLKANKQKVSRLDGGHIHFDAAFMKDRNAYINLLELYFSTEKLLYIISNEKGTKPREETVLDCGYAKPLSKMFFDRCQEMNEEEIETLKYLNDKEFINKIKVLQETRNFGINFSNVDDGSKMDINTIEFRMPNGTINPDVWIENINLFGGIIKVANELSIIQSKDILSKEEERKIQIFNKIKDSNTSEKEKLEYLLILTIPEENREIYINRYIVNKELLKQDEERNYELNEFIYEDTVNLDIWRPTIEKIGKYCYGTDNLYGEPVNGCDIKNTANRIYKDLGKSKKQEKDNIKR